MSWFVLRPTGLFEPTFRNDMFGKIGRTSWKVYEQPGKTWQWVSCTDIGHFAAQGFINPKEWSGRCLSLAGWEGSFAEANTIHKAVTGKEMTLTFGILSRILCGVVVKDLGLSWKWCNEKGFGADIQRLRRLNPSLMGLEEWLKEVSE